MELRELNEDEAVALVALLREVVQADGVYSDEERERVHALTDALGAARFEAAMERAKREFASRSELKQFAKTLRRAEARQIMYDFLLSVAQADGLDEAEEKPLAWLKAWWGIS